MNDEDFMRRALAISLQGNPSPNPYVGAVIVRDGRVLSEGFHHRAGRPHAEVEALKGVDAKGATLYVTLEPCSHWGRTPPCTKAIIESGISEVVYAVDDPTDKVKGREELKAAGINVRSGILQDECRKANEIFFKFSGTGLPFVLGKSAMSLDGQIATSSGESKWITSEASRKMANELRGRYDAIMVGVNTVLADDPELTCRVKGGRDPLRVILDSRLRIPLGAKVLRDQNVLVVTTESHDREKMNALQGRAKVLVLGQERVNLRRLMKELGQSGVTSVLIEGGATINYSATQQGLIDKYLFFIGPKLMLGENTPAFRGTGIRALADAKSLAITSVSTLDGDIVVEAYPLNPRN
jgi:diaminohydroxyphosphoribosylaminopyrimidine deaminase/5-amino-6-(5-phosphoribosylamino)uracil reductase